MTHDQDKDKDKDGHPRIDPGSLDYFAGEIKTKIEGLDGKIEGCIKGIADLSTTVNSLKEATVEGFNGMDGRCSEEIAGVNIRCSERLGRIEKLEKIVRNRGNSFHQKSLNQKILLWGLLVSIFSGLVVGMILHSVDVI